ncbi:MAG: hypothetical protein Q9164_003416 [Protoblastenia rupestris]
MIDPMLEKASSGTKASADIHEPPIRVSSEGTASNVHVKDPVLSRARTLAVATLLALTNLVPE